MATYDRLPSELDCSNLSRDWPNWKRTFQMYMMATGKDGEKEPKKIASFLWLIGKRGMEIYDTLFPNDGTAEGLVGNLLNPATVTSNSVYCIPRRNITMESFKFNNIVQKEKQSFADFETELRTQVQYCTFKCTCGLSYEDRMLIDRIIIGVNDKKLQLKLLDTKDEKLFDVINKCKAFEAASQNKLLLDKNIQPTINSVENQRELHLLETKARRCYNCGSSFQPGHVKECRARNVQCRSCLRVGHFAKWCKQSKQENKSNKNVDDKPRKAGNNFENKTEGVDNTTKAIGSIDWNVTGNSSNLNVGSVSTISHKLIYRVSSNNRGSNSKWIKTYLVDGEPIKLDMNNKSLHQAEFLVVDDNREPILGLDTCVAFGLIKRLDVSSIERLPKGKDEFIKKFRDIFDGIDATLSAYPTTTAAAASETTKTIFQKPQNQQEKN
ncbi:Gag polyprotein, partial [Pseudolycoriella hygida]